MNIFLCAPTLESTEYEAKETLDKMAKWIKSRYGDDVFIFTPSVSRTDLARDGLAGKAKLALDITTLMSCCELVVLHPQWRDYPECYLLKTVADTINLPVIELTDADMITNFYGPAATVKDMLTMFRSLCEANGIDFTDPVIAKPWEEMLDKVKNKEEE